MEPQETLSASQMNLFKKKLPFSLSEFQIINTIGKGSQGEVYEASNIHFSEKIAIKSIKLPKNNFRAQKVLKRIQSQIIINTEIQQSDNSLSKYFPQFHGYFVENQTFYLIFQLCAFNAMQIYNRLKTYAQKYTFCWILLYDMIKSLSLLEKKQIFHRDIKPQNILFKDNFFKLTDLGLAKQGLGSRNVTMDAGNIFSKAPEVYIGKYDIKSDIWGLGITLYYLLEGKLPYDNETIQMMMEEDKIQNYIERIKTKQFFINLCQQQIPKGQTIHAFPLYEIMKKMLNVSLQERYLASEIDLQFFRSIQIDQINHDQIIKDIIQSQKPENPVGLENFLRHLILKYLEHRESELGLFYVISFGCIKEALYINRKLFKINTFLENNCNIRNKKKILERKLLKNIKTSCFKLIQVLFKQMEDQSIQNKQVIQQITSFGQIQLSIEPWLKSVHEDHKKLQTFICVLLQNYNQYLFENDEKQNIQIQKQIHEKMEQKSVNFNEVLMCISDNNTNHAFMPLKEGQKSFSKIKSKKKLQALVNNIKQMLPKSINYINDEEFQKGKTNEMLENFLKFYSKDKLKERFPLLGEMGELLKKLIDSSEDPTKRKILISSDIRLWNLNLDLFRI